MTAQLRKQRLIDEIAKLAASGLSIHEAAEQLDYCYQRIYTLARENQITFVRKRRSLDGSALATAARDQEIKSRFLSGETLESIGADFNITRERVRQILAKDGIYGPDGGASVKAAENAQQKFTAREKACLAKWGCSPEQYDSLVKIGRDMVANGFGRLRTPKGAFRQQKSNARIRGIKWELTLWQWWTVWQESGRWADRGRGHGFVMCRKGDAGPYSVDNVYIAPGHHNSSERIAKKSGLPIGVSERGNRFLAAIFHDGKKHRLGLFETPEEANKAYLARLSQISCGAA